MLRQSLLNEAQKDWHPPVPSKDVIILQVAEAKGRIGGNERLATMRVSVGSKMPSAPMFCLKQMTLSLRGSIHKMTKRLKGLK